MTGKKQRITPYFVITVILLILLAIFFLFPLYWIVTGSVKEILPVVRVGSQKIGSGRPGPAVQRLQHIFLQNMPKWLDK